MCDEANFNKVKVNVDVDASSINSVVKDLESMAAKIDDLMVLTDLVRGQLNALTLKINIQ